MDETPKRTFEEKLQLTQDAVAQRAESVRLMRELVEHPGWGFLKAQHEEKRRQFEASLGQSLIAGKDLDQRQIDYNRGFFAGVGQLMDAPEKAEELLARALKRLEQLESRIEPEEVIE